MASALTFAGLLTLTIPLHAEISEPDNVLYGSIVLSNTPVTAADTGVVIQARRTETGPAMASYRMGTDARLGNFYSLDLKFESLGVVSDPNASTAGQQVFVVLTDNGKVVGQTSYTFPARGHVQRVDFGAPLDDADGNGLPDLWELSWLGSAGNNVNALGMNGQTLMANYIAGTDPENPEDAFRVEIDRAGSAVNVWFHARRAEGPGYSGKSRFYTLESRSALGSGDWTEVSAVAGVTGNDQTVVYDASGANPMTLYRGRVSLAAVQVPGAPRLAIGWAAPGNLRLAWPSGFTGFVLQENGSLDAGGWSDVGVTPTNEGVHWSVILNPPSGARYYRLRD